MVSESRRAGPRRGPKTALAISTLSATASPRIMSRRGNGIYEPPSRVTPGPNSALVFFIEKAKAFSRITSRLVAGI